MIYFSFFSIAIYLIACVAYYGSSTPLMYNDNATYNVGYTAAPPHSTSNAGLNLTYSQHKNQPTCNSFKRWLEKGYNPIVHTSIKNNLATIAFFTRKRFYTTDQYFNSLSLRSYSLRGPPAFIA